VVFFAVLLAVVLTVALAVVAGLSFVVVQFDLAFEFLDGLLSVPFCPFHVYII